MKTGPLGGRWLAGHRAGEHAGEAGAFPGYCTLHTWHSTFLGMQEDPGSG